MKISIEVRTIALEPELVLAAECHATSCRRLPRRAQGDPSFVYRWIVDEISTHVDAELAAATWARASREAP